MLHEVPDQAGLFRPVTKLALRVERAADVGDAVALALHRASAPPGRPVYVEVPTDLLSAEGAAARRASAPRGEVADPALGPAAALLADVRRPLVWAGGGAVDAGGAVAALAERLGAPIFTTYTARGVAGDHPLAVGLPPHLPRT